MTLWRFIWLCLTSVRCRKISVSAVLHDKNRSHAIYLSLNSVFASLTVYEDSSSERRETQQLLLREESSF